jgi:hypothetical protein
LRVRHEAGYGGARQAAAFARAIGIRPASLHDLEHGQTKTIGTKSLRGYVRIGASLDWLLYGRGEPMLHRNLESTKDLKALQELLLDLAPEDRRVVLELAESLRRAHRRPEGEPPDGS